MTLIQSRMDQLSESENSINISAPFNDIIERKGRDINILS